MKIRAYTLIETMLTLIVSGIIIVFIYTMYLYFDKQLLNFKSSNENLLSYLLLDKDLSQCFYNAENIEASSNLILFKFYDTSTKEYSFRNDSIFRIIGGNKFYTGLRSKAVTIETEQKESFVITKVQILLFMDGESFSRTYIHKRMELKINKI